MAGGFLTGKVNEVPDREKELTIADSFVITMHWLSPKERDLIGKQCVVYKKGSPDVDRDRHARVYTRRVVKGWRGLTLDVLTGPLKMELFPDAVADLKKIQADNKGELPFNQADSEVLYLNALSDKYANKIKETMDDWDEEDRTKEDDIEGK